MNPEQVVELLTLLQRIADVEALAFGPTRLELDELLLAQARRAVAWQERVEDFELLRDRFAMAALTGLLAAGKGVLRSDEYEPTAAEAFNMADTMLKAKGKTDG